MWMSITPYRACVCKQGYWRSRITGYSGWFRLAYSRMKISTPLYEGRNPFQLQLLRTNRTRDSPMGLDPNPGLDKKACEVESYRLCADGSCISQVDLCPEEQLMNQNTILIMIVVGLAVVIFLIVLYCFQQRNRSPTHSRGRSVRSSGTNGDEADRISLFLPPPTYDEVITTNLYPPTPQIFHRRDRITSSEEPPMTPPPNYDTALMLLSRSHESVLSPSYDTAPKRPSLNRGHRRSLSVDHLSPNLGDTSVQIFHFQETAEPNPDKANLNTISEGRWQKTYRTITLEFVCGPNQSGLPKETDAASRNVQVLP